MDLLVEASLNVNTKILTLTDLIAAAYNTTYGYTLSNVEGIFKVTGPAGIIYENAGYATDDYTSPDVVGATPDWGKGGLALPVDSDGVVLLGDYQIEYKVTLDGTGTTTFSFDKTYSHAYVRVSSLIETSIKTALSYMIVTDSTTYTVIVGGISYVPTNTIVDSRVLTTVWPASSGVADSVTALASLQVGPNLWTGSYDISVTADVVYDLSTIAGLTVEIVDEISGSDDTVSVSADECTQVVYNCLVTLTAQYEQAKKYNIPLAEELRRNLNDINLYYDMYDMAVSLGEDTAYACAILRELIVVNGCSDEVETSTSSEELLPTT